MKKDMTERDYVTKAFRKHFINCKSNKIVIYGLGKNTQVLLQNFTEYQFAGLMDENYTGDVVYGKKVFSFAEVESEKADLILIMARQSNVQIIYHRIESFCRKNQIAVFDINGTELSKKRVMCNKGYSDFLQTQEQVKAEIVKYDVISFDIFETLVTRKTLCPEDIFYIVERQARYRYGIVCDFFKWRIESERQLSMETVPNIFEIYKQMQRSIPLSDFEMNELLDLELEVEKNNLIARDNALQLFRWSIDNGKEVYLISDTYLPVQTLSDILKNMGINGYKKLYTSCEERKSKRTGLYRKLKSQLGEKRILHIGNNSKLDGIMAEREGIQSIIIKRPMEMLELSKCQNLLQNCKSPQERWMLGTFVSKAFQNPFLFSKTNGKIYISSCRELGYLLLGPIITAFLNWLINELKNNKDGIILFSARDGYLIEKLYRKIKSEEMCGDLPESIYFLASRMACTAAGIMDFKDITSSFALAFSGTPEEMVEKRYFVPKGDIKPYKSKQNLREFLLENESTIFASAKKHREGYMKYIHTLGLHWYSHIYFFDFVSSGTCQRFLKNLIPQELEGYYFMRILDEDEKKQKLKIKSLYQPVCAYEKQKSIGRLYLYLEQIITAATPSLQHFDTNGEPVYLSEKRTVNQIRQIEETQQGIEQYVAEFYKNYPEIPKESIQTELPDKILSLLQNKYSIMENGVFSEDAMYDEFCNRQFQVTECITG